MEILSILITLIALSATFISSLIAQNSNTTWYKNTQLPFWTPPAETINQIWFFIIVCTFVSAIIVWNKSHHDKKLWQVMTGFIISAVLNIFWGYLFTNQQLMEIALIEAGMLNITIISLIFLIWSISKLAAILLLPYAGWAVFIAYSAYNLWLINQ